MFSDRFLIGLERPEGGLLGVMALDLELNNMSIKRHCLGMAAWLPVVGAAVHCFLLGNMNVTRIDLQRPELLEAYMKRQTV